MSFFQYSANHIWVMREDDELVSIGLSEYAQKQLKNIVFISLPDLGEYIREGERMGDLESLKTVTDLISPVSGIVMSVNDELIDCPDKMNKNPYESWLLRVKIDTYPETLMDEIKYQNYVERL